MAEQPSEREALSAQITAYLAGGGLWNPELADHIVVRDMLIACRAALSKPSTEQGWRTIESAPKDAERLILAADGRTFYGAWINIPFKEYRDGDGFYVGQQDPESYWMDIESGDEVEPTHWQPLADLPPPPIEPREEKL